MDSIDEINESFPFPQRELDRLQNRRWILDFVQQGDVGAEVGVFRGHFAEILCDVLKPKTLYLIDPWEKMGELFGFSSDYTNGGLLPTRIAKQETVLRLQSFSNINIKFIEGFFPEDASFEHTLDWVYLDASHSFDATLRELRYLDGIVTEKGCIFGDDWVLNPNHSHYGVFKAVQQFVKETRWMIIAAGPGGQWCLRRY